MVTTGSLLLLFCAQVWMVEANIVITEIMNNPSLVADELGEWFEVFNTGTAPINLFNWTVLGGSAAESFVITAPLLVQPQAYAVFGPNNNVATNGNVAIAFVYPGGFTGYQLLNGDPDSIVLLNELRVEQDRVTYSGSSNINGLFPNRVGASMSLRDPTLDNSIGTNWCSTAILYNTVDKGTPGAANICPVVVPTPAPVTSPVKAPVKVPKAPPVVSPKTPRAPGTQAPTIGTISPSPSPGSSILPTSSASPSPSPGGEFACEDPANACKGLFRAGVRVRFILLGICIDMCSKSFLGIVQTIGWECGSCP